MRKTTIFLLVVSLVISCHNKQETKVTRFYAEFEILNDELMSNSRGRDLFILSNNTVWYDLSTSDNFLHVLNKEDGKEVHSAGKVGYGRNEYASPFINKIIWNNYLYIYDLMGHTKQYFSADSLKKGGDGFIQLSKEDSVIRTKGYDMRLEDNLYITLNTRKEEGPYRLYSNGREKTFGEYILKDEKQHFYPITLYNPDKKLLVMGSEPLNYFCCYKKEGDNFKLIWENRRHYVYGKRNGHIILDDSRKGTYGIALTKDFIVAIQRDYENDRTSESAVLRDISLLPQTLFVYDYKGKLLKIINYNVPISNIAGDIKNNIIYAIYADPNFKLGISPID